ncbi:RNA methyltransferase [Lentilactobacillus sp. Marseille-Q4993]|uniref:TrmH family RNA methyltransferase n=1 Tax=Lentilactobacillus sp. Marseille-Q4993 TaxID=3039492 RepID=UPI0024BD26B4|nr:RNA methyltransferase [Lentilactobacillus sp. Marseille-Q4993]
MKIINSKQNNHVKEWKKLQTKKERTKTGQYMIEGWHLINEALQNDKHILAAIVTDENDADKFETRADDVFLVSEEIGETISDTKTPQGVFAVMEAEDYHETIPDNLDGQWLLLDGVQDPGNIGTIVRTADAAGINGVVFGKGSVDIYNPKLIRSMQGSHFHIQLFQGELTEWIEKLHESGIKVYGTELNKDALPYNEVQGIDRFAFIVGNEGNGVSDEVLSLTDNNLYIPMPGKAESLNVAVATGIVLFHLVNNSAI